METINIGGERLGSGAKMNVALRNFERSTHDLGYIWRNTQAPGTLVPFMVEVGLPGDTFDINLNADIKTVPTVGALFASFKLQLDIFNCPIRLYEGKLHNNKLNIGLDMSKIKLPQLIMEGKGFNINETKLNQEQISSSSLINYLGIKGLGYVPNKGKIQRKKNAIPYLAYWDIYKNYYANKQEEIGAFINYQRSDTETIVELFADKKYELPINKNLFTEGIAQIDGKKIKGVYIREQKSNAKNIFFIFKEIQTQRTIKFRLEEIGKFIDVINNNVTYWEIDTTKIPNNVFLEKINQQRNRINIPIAIDTFPLENIDEMREDIYVHSKKTSPFEITKKSKKPYGSGLNNEILQDGQMLFSLSQQGLALKTYQSDIFNNWISTEWLEGENGINAITAIDTSSGSFTMDTLNLSKKVYDMLNRIAVSGGSYQDWLEAVYSHKSWNKAETPVYMGGLSQEIVFEEVVSNSAVENEPLGTLAGKGRLMQNKKGGNITIKCDEPSFIIGIVSITPRIDYSQGNEWFTRLETMNDLHKPSLDGIGFQDLITEQMASWESHGTNNETEKLFSAGKQPAWINYMTNYNKCYGGFAEVDNQMFMTLNRRYEINKDTGRIKDLTTYIDPSKFNYAFADTDLQAQNFFVQIAVNNTARRKMSAKQIPNL